MVLSGILLYFYPVVCKVSSFESAMEWRTSQLNGPETKEEMEIRESIIFMGSHADSAITQWRGKVNAASALLILFGLVTLLIQLNQKPDPDATGQRR